MRQLITRRRFINTSATGFGAAAGLGYYTFRFEPCWLEVVERALPIEHLPEDLHGWRLAHLSDLHISSRVDERYLRETFERVQELDPHLVVYTGDFITHEPGIFDRAERLFSHLPVGSRRTVGVFGNHDYGRGWSQPQVAQSIAELAGAVGIRILRNESIDVAGLHLVGLDEVWARRFDLEEAFRMVPDGVATLTLSHNPDTADFPGWEGYNGWILSGHTHGGQCKPPFLPPPLLPVRNRRYTAGEFALPGGRRMYISRGVGHLLPVRFNVRPEVTLFHLERQPHRPA